MLDFASVLKDVLVRFDNLWQMAFPYVMPLHQAPTDGGDYSGFHFHIEFHPPLRKPDLLKFLAGPEVGGGNFLSDTSPEEKAAELRAQARRPLQRIIEMTNEGARDIHQFLGPVRSLHEQIRASVVEACKRASSCELATVVSEQEGDTIFALDRVSEELLIDFFEREVATHTPVVLIAEGLIDGQITLPRGTAESDVVWRIIVDPIDGTRGLMYQKRSGWILTGVAPNRGPGTSSE